MTDEEIKTKRLSDWKPETDIKLQKAFGKFVEEAGELLEVIPDFMKSTDYKYVHDFENELADTLAFIFVIQKVVGSFDISDSSYSLDLQDKYIAGELVRSVGVTLSVVGRCQIQGLGGKHPESGVLNVVRLEVAMRELASLIFYNVKMYGLSKDRIIDRMSAKVDSKLPWVMGTASDLLPDIQTP